jgi:hypothetical protein
MQVLVKQSLVLSCIVTFLVWMNTPMIIYNNEVERRYHNMKIIFRTFLLSFLLIWCYLYFSKANDGGDDVVSNMIKSEPDF